MNKHNMQSLNFFVGKIHSAEKDIKQIIHPLGQLPMSPGMQYYINFYHASSVWMHRSLRLWWQQLLSLSNDVTSDLAAKVMNHVFLYLIKAVCICWKLAIWNTSNNRHYTQCLLEKWCIKHWDLNLKMKIAQSYSPQYHLKQ